MKHKLIYYGIFLVLLVGIYGAGGLVLAEIRTGQGCPKIWIIPACLIVLICYIVPAVVHAFNRWNVIYYVFTGAGFAIGAIASIRELMGIGQCPQFNGIPMCYLSLFLITLLIILKILFVKLNKP